MKSAFFFVGLLWAGAAVADEAMRTKVLDLLSAYESTPTAAEWQAMGSAAAEELFSIAQDKSTSHFQRVRATHALGYFPTDTYRTWLASQLAATTTDAETRRAACYALANGWGDAALPELGAALGDNDVQLRNAAARAISRIGTPASRQVLEARLAVETNSMVRTTLSSLLAK